MEKLFFAKIEAWVLFLCLLLGAAAAIGFGSLVLDSTEKDPRFPRASRAAATLAEAPHTIRQLLSKDQRLVAPSSAITNRLRPGWNINGPLPGLNGYILLSRYDGAASRHVIELVSLPTMKVTHQWAMDASTLLKGAARKSNYADYTTWDHHFRAIHPFLTPAGDLIIKDHYSPLVSIAPCGDRKWMIDHEVFHHSTEADADGNLWLPSLAEVHRLPHLNSGTHEDLLVKVSPDGKILYQRSVLEILVSHGLSDLVFSNGMYNEDPTHLNDIEPALSDGPFWKKGDLFLSLRNISTIMLFRPSTNQIVWMKRGPWISQHDVDIVDDHRISVYNNNAQDRGTQSFVDGSSDVLVYDFKTGALTSPLRKTMADNGFRTLAAGLYTPLSAGYAVIEDESKARLMLVRPDGTSAGEFVNRANGDNYHLGWSRFIAKDQGDAALSRLREAKCHA